MQVADAVARALRARGVTRAYGLPGEDHMTLLDALQRAGVGYRAAYNETSAVLMAAADAQVSRIPGLAVLSLAPGISNGVNGLLHAHMEQVPLVVVSGQHPADRLPFVVRQGFEVRGLLDPVTKWGARLSPGTDVDALVAQLLDVAVADPPGPVYLEVPDDVAIGEAVPSTSGADSAAGPAPRSAGPDVQDLDWLVDRLAAARRPVLVVGGRRTGVSQATVGRFATTLRCPTLTSSAQKGLLDVGNPFFAGTFLNGRLDTALLAESDLVLMVNPEAFDVYNRAPAFDAETIALSPAPLTERQLPFSRRIVGDPEVALASLADRVSPASTWSTGDVAGHRGRVRGTVLDPGGSALTVPAAVAAALSEFPHDGYLVADAGFSKPLVALLSEPSAPGRYLASNALSTMGFAIPAAFGAGEAGAAPVLAFLGDGSLLMRATELATLAGSSATLAVVAMLDRSFTQIEIKQERRRLAPVGAALPALEAAQLARALGVRGRDVHDAGGLATAVAEALVEPGPVLIGAHVDGGPSRAVFEALRS